MLTPVRQDVRLDSAAGRAVVVETGDAAVNLERGNEEQAALERVDDGVAERLPGEGAVAGATGDGGLEPLLDVGLLDLEVVEGLDGGVDLRLRRLAGLEGADGVALGVDGGLPAGEGLAERVLGGVHGGRGGGEEARDGETRGEGSR